MLTIEETDGHLYLVSDDKDAENARVQDLLEEWGDDWPEVRDAWAAAQVDEEGKLRMRLDDPQPFADLLEDMSDWPQLGDEIRQRLQARHG